MTVYIALLRGVNVGGHGKIRMDDLRGLFANLGYPDARTYIQSGNVLFSSQAGDAQDLSMEIEQSIQRDLGVASTVILRTSPELADVVRSSPFAARGLDMEKVYVTFLARDPDAERAARFEKPTGAPEELELKGRELYLYCPEGYGRSKVAGAYVERRLGVPVTSRNWRVVTALEEMARGRETSP